ncbi:MAG: disulfide bond formation protein B [Gemmatimonadales bacterium]|jgi:disulfide bond formation protein DsbB
MPLSEERLRAILAWVVIVLVGGPVASAVLLGVLEGDSPCILCWAERTSMVLIALCALFVIRYGPRPRYIGVVVLLGVWGVYMGLRHSALHLARDVGQGFSAAIFGVHTYVWALVIHVTVLAVIGALLLFMREIAPAEGPRLPSRAGRFAMGLFVVVIAANALQAFASTGPPPFFGQGDPVRLSLNPRHWVWSFEELEPYHISLRGSWTIPVPNPAAADPDPAHGPLAGLPALAVTSWERVGAPLNGALSGLARDSATRRFLAVTDHYGVYLLDSTLTHVLHHVVLDKGFSVDLTPLAGAAFVGGDTLGVLSTNKSYALLTSVPHADERAEWRHFLETDGQVSEVALGRFQTVRAHQMYVLSLAFDPAAQELIAVSVPNPRHHQLVVSRFARKDLTLSSEFEPQLTAGLTLRSPDRTPAEYVVTGAVVADGRLYAISAAYSTLLVVDLKDRTLQAAYAVPGLAHPVGLAARGADLLVAQADGRIAVLARPVR